MSKTSSSNTHAGQPGVHGHGGGNVGLAGLVVGAIGVVFGDIGTSPLYTLKEAFSGHYGLTADHDTVLGVLSASVANIMQASQPLKRRPIASMLAWGMVYGVIANAVFAWVVYGPPVFEARLGYWAGVAYLGLAASALAFTFYFAIIRAIGPGKAAYSSVIVPIIAMALSTAFEGYVWSPLAIGGGVLAMIGLVIALQARKPVVKPGQIEA